MTLGFTKNETGQVQLQVQAWGVRGNKGQSEPLFKEPFRDILGSIRKTSAVEKHLDYETLELAEPV
jgi:hypothetical protein